MGVLDGLSAMGTSLAQTAQAATLDTLRAQAEQDKIKLADQLAGVREEKGRQFQTSEREATQTFTGGENEKNRTTTLEGHRISASATLGASATSAAASRYNADKQFEAAKLRAEKETVPNEIKIAKWLTEEATPEQKTLVSGWVTGKSEKESFELLPAAEAEKLLGKAYDPSKSYQRSNRGKIEPVGGSLVNINNQTEAGFSKKLGEQDATRIGEIQENTKNVIDVAAKVRQATDFLAKTYTGPGAGTADAFFKALGTLGVESAKGKANAATAAQAIISELTPKMRVPGSGATSDYEMRVFAAALPGMLNLPGGNEMVAAYWQKIADRALQIQEIAEKHAVNDKALTGTEFSKQVAGLGSLFSKDELAQMRGISSNTPTALPAPKDRVIDQVYNTPTGPFRWKGNGWQAVQPGESP